LNQSDFPTLWRVWKEVYYKNPTREDVRDYLEQTKTPFGTVEHLKPVLHMSQTPPKIFLPAVPLGYNLPKWRET